MTAGRIELIEPVRELSGEFEAVAEEYRALGDPRYVYDARNIDDYLGKCAAARDGIGLRGGIVPWTTYWLVRDGERLLGLTDLRHELNNRLRIEGGHIGYNIRPSERRKGYGTLILKLALEKAKARGIERALVTCDTDNIGSGKIIRRNGGVFDGESPSPHTGKPVSRYWIDLTEEE